MVYVWCTKTPLCWFLQRHILAVYVHNDRSISVNIFVTQVLQETVLIDYIRDHVVLWPWDITLPESRAILRNEVEEVLGMQGAIPIVTSAVDKFPMMFICSKIRGSVELLRVVDGSKSAQEVLNAFEFVEEMHSDAQDAEMMDQVSAHLFCPADCLMYGFLTASSS